MENSEERIQRVLRIFGRLTLGEGIRKKDLADEFNVSARTVQRDIEDIRTYLADNEGENELVYEAAKRQYRLRQNNKITLTMKEIFALLKILLESRAFNKDEMYSMVQALLSSIPEQEKSFLKKSINNEWFHYQPLQHGKPLLRLIWELESAVYEQKALSIRYKKVNGERIDRIVHPVALLFSEFYFYLIARIEDAAYTQPAYFRVDRITQIENLQRNFSVPRKYRFEEGELRKYIQFMYGGEMETIQFLCKEHSLESILDRFPTARIVQAKEDGYIIEAKVMGRGCLMWLMSQGKSIEIIKPDSLREEMRGILSKLGTMY